MENDALKAFLMGFKKGAEENAKQEASLAGYDSYSMGVSDGQIEVIDIVMRFIDKD